MAYGSLNNKEMDAARKMGGIPRVSTRFSLSMENDPGWRGKRRPNQSREVKFSGANGDREKMIFPVRLTTSMIGKLTPVDLYSAIWDGNAYSITTR